MRRSLRILHLVETLEVGGTESQAVQIAIRQQAKGHNVTVGCLRAKGPLLKVLQDGNVPVLEFRKRTKLLSIAGVRQLFRLRSCLRHNRFDVVHSHDLMSNLLGVPAARLAGTPMIVSSRRYLDLEWWSGKWRTRTVAWIYKWSDYVIVNSRSVRNLLLEREGALREKLHVLYNSVDAERFRTSERQNVAISLLPKDSSLIAVVANMYSPVKGHAILVNAAIDVCRHFPNVFFALIGDGKMRRSIERQVRELNLERNFLFLGSRADIPEILACCDISVLPSESEGFPNAVLESMAAGLPVIATSVGGVPEIIEDEVTGLLVPPSNPAALSGAILRLLNNQDLRKQIAAAGHKRVVERFSFDRLIDSLDALYMRNPIPRSVICTHKQRIVALPENSSFCDARK